MGWSEGIGEETCSRHDGWRGQKLEKESKHAVKCGEENRRKRCEKEMSVNERERIRGHVLCTF